MANAKISSLPAASALAGTEPLPIVQGGITAKTTVDSIAARATKTVQFAASDETTALNSIGRQVGRLQTRVQFEEN